MTVDVQFLEGLQKFLFQDRHLLLEWLRLMEVEQWRELASDSGGSTQETMFKIHTKVFTGGH